MINVKQLISDWRALRQVISVFVLVVLTSVSYAKETESHEELSRQIYEFLETELKRSGAESYDIAVGRIDPRLKLAQCRQPVQVSFLGKKRLSGKVNVRLDCNAPTWSIFVPSEIKLTERIVVSTVSLPRGTRIQASQVSLQVTETSSLHYTYFRDLSQVIGTTTTRPIQSGDVIFTNMIKASNAVHKGDNVVIRAVAGSLAVRMQGTALQDGAIGKQIQVRNNQSQRIIRAIVTGAGQVEVPM